jgi:hypothetical protein
MIQLTEEEFRNIMGYILHKYITLFPEQIITQAKKDGWIKKTALEEARKYVQHVMEYIDSYKDDRVKHCVELYEKAIKEIQEKE